MDKSIYIILLSMLSFLFSLGYKPCHATEYYSDSFETNTLSNYSLTGTVTWQPSTQNVKLGLGPGMSNNEMYTTQPFSNSLVVQGKAYIPSTGVGLWDSVAIALWDTDKSIKYWATIAYGPSLPMKDRISIMRNDTWGELIPFTVEGGRWYNIKVRVDVLEMRMKCWKDTDPEPAEYQTSRQIETGWTANGGIGFRHFGTGAFFEDLQIEDYGYQDPSQNNPLYNNLPRPILNDHPDWIELYWKAWDIARTKIQHGTVANGFVESYMDEGFNPNIFQWDTCFMMFFARYGHNYFPSIVSLENFYGKQHADGFICREIRETDGSDYHDKYSDQSINPPLFSWAEWGHYLITGDKRRLQNTLPNLKDYFQWIKQNRRRANGLYWQSNLGSGMDNSPRYGYSWVDLSAQQAINAMFIAKIAEEIGDTTTAAAYQQEYEDLKALIQSKCWDSVDGLYYDLNDDESLHRVKTSACFWVLLAEVCTPEQAETAVAHLQNPDEFSRTHLFPTLSADHSVYDSTGNYWRGSIWAPTNYMVVSGLHTYGYDNYAAQVAQNHIENMSQVYKNTGTIWENYAPDFVEPGSISRGDFVGWSGCGPIAMLIENILGFRPDSATDTLNWRLRLTEKNGIENLRFNNHILTIFCEERNLQNDDCHIHITTDSEFILEIDTGFGQYQVGVIEGENFFVFSGSGGDSDYDGMPDWWENQYIDPTDPSASPLNPAFNDALLDNDSDGKKNYKEYLSATDPTDPNSVFALTNITRGSVSVEWSSVTGKEYAVYYSDEEFGDSMNWSLAEDGISASGTGTNTWTDNGDAKTGNVPPEDVRHRYYKVCISGTDVFARDTVGIYKALLRNSLYSGMNYVAIPFVPFDNSLNAVLGEQLTGSTIPAFACQCWKWNQDTLSYERAFYYGDGIRKEWRDFNNPTQPAIFTFDADGGYIILLTPITPDNTPLYFVGKVSDVNRNVGPLKSTFTSGINYVGSAYPTSVSLDDSGLLASGFTGGAFYAFSDKLWLWDWDARSYKKLYYNTTASQWRDYPAETATIRQLTPGEGFRIILTPTSGLKDNYWTYPKPYTKPPN